MRFESSDPDSDIEACFDAFSALRPHLTRAAFLSRVKKQQRQSYEILAVAVEGKFPSAGRCNFEAGA
jgi:hypothetical protein